MHTERSKAYYCNIYTDCSNNDDFGNITSGKGKTSRSNITVKAKLCIM